MTQDLTESDAQEEYDQNPVLRAILTKAQESQTISRERRLPKSE